MATNDNNTYVDCPLVDEPIDGFDCMEFQCVRAEAIPDRFKQKEDWETICKNCKYREY